MELCESLFESQQLQFSLRLPLNTHEDQAGSESRCVLDMGYVSLDLNSGLTPRNGFTFGSTAARSSIRTIQGRYC